MSTSASSEESPRWAWLAHHQIALIAGAIVARVAADATGIEALQWPATLLLLVFITSQFATIKHTGILCERCRDAVPTDASVQVVQKDWQLRMRHWIADHPLLAMVPTLAFVAADVAAHGWFIVLAWMWFGLEAWVQRFHNRVAPWCKYCRDDGWDETWTPAPDPSQVKAA